jgi:hypothetical protein
VTRAVVEGRATGGNVHDRKRTARVVRYAGGWDVVLSVGGRDPNRTARAAIALDPDQARTVARELSAAADVADAERTAANRAEAGA